MVNYIKNLAWCVAVLAVATGVLIGISYVAFLLVTYPLITIITIVLICVFAGAFLMTLLEDERED